MVLIGAANPDTIAREWLDALAGDPSVLVFTETTSNIHHEGFISNIDSILWPIERTADPGQKFAALKPDLLVTLGGMVVSKKIKAFLRQHRPARHWHVDPLRAYDTYFSLTDHLRVNPNRFFEALAPFMPPTQSPYRDLWVAQRNLHRKKRDEYLQTIPFSDMLAFHHLLGHIPEGYQVQLANSSTVRYTQLFDLPPSLRVFCNRGTSGIDGSTSTAVGASLASEAPTLLLTGDLSFLYDSNGLWNRYIRPDFRIIVINNGGGGIFRILPGQEESETYETFFETTQDLDLQGLARVYGFSHSKAENEDELLASMADFYAFSGKPKILEIRTPRLLNNKILLTYFDFLS